MFYEQLLLTKKGALANIWLAAHWDKKLSKFQIESTDLVNSIDSILGQYLALRLSGHLLLGAARIYNKKIYFLFGECKEALLKIRTIFKPALEVDLDEPVAALTAITLPQNFGDIEIRLPESIDGLEFPLNEKEMEDGFSLFNIRSKELIPLQFPAGDVDIFPYSEMDDQSDLSSQGLFSSQIKWDIEQQRREEDLLASADKEQSIEFQPGPLPQLDLPELSKEGLEGEFDLPPAIGLEHDDNVELSVSTETHSSRVDLSLPFAEMVPPPPSQVARQKRKIATSLDKYTQISNESMAETINNPLYFHNEEFEFVPMTKKAQLVSGLDLEADLSIQLLLKDYDDTIYKRNRAILGEIVEKIGGDDIKRRIAESGPAGKVWDVEAPRDQPAVFDETVSVSSDAAAFLSTDAGKRYDDDDAEIGLVPRDTGDELPGLYAHEEETESVDANIALPPHHEEETQEGHLKLSENTNRVKAYFKYWADNENKIQFLEQCQKHESTRHQVAQAFFGILEMVTKNFAIVNQVQPWGEIVVTLL